jgi:hypothetical protein
LRRFMIQGFLPLYRAAKGREYVDFFQMIAHSTS